VGGATDDASGTRSPSRDQTIATNKNIATVKC
jgi:hypothetical protein